MLEFLCFARAEFFVSGRLNNHYQNLPRGMFGPSERSYHSYVS